MLLIGPSGVGKSKFMNQYALKGLQPTTSEGANRHIQLYNQEQFNMTNNTNIGNFMQMIDHDL